MQRIVVGIVGSGRAAELHQSAYSRVHGFEVVIKGIYDSDSKKTTVKSLDALLNDSEIDVIDVCTPPYAHKDIIIKALSAGKHVICEKPLTGCFNPKASKNEMMATINKEIKEIETAIKKSRKQFFYAENYIYAPAIQRATEILKARKSRILFAKGEESLKGSSSPVAGRWDKTGGGVFIRTGIHALSAILYLKQIEAKAHNEVIEVESVVSDMGQITNKLTKKEHRAISAQPVDVEDLSIASYTFTDGSKAVVMAEDVLLGGSRNYIELYCNDMVLNCNLTLTNQLQTYLPDDEKLENIELSEMLPVKTGWNNAFVDDITQRGYAAEMQDFIECIALNRKPLSGFDLAKDTIRLIYSAYTQSR